MSTRKISGKELAADIRAGFTCAQLMERHSLSESSLDQAFEKLVSSGLVGKEELPAKIQRSTEEWECLACGAKRPNKSGVCPTCGLKAATVAPNVFGKKRLVLAGPPGVSSWWADIPCYCLACLVGYVTNDFTGSTWLGVIATGVSYIFFWWIVIGLFGSHIRSSV